jgi:hypothetical protein
VSSVRGCALFRCHLVKEWQTKRLIAAGRCQLPAASSDIGKARKQQQTGGAERRGTHASDPFLLGTAVFGNADNTATARKICAHSGSKFLMWDFLGTRHTLPIRARASNRGALPPPPRSSAWRKWTSSSRPRRSPRPGAAVLYGLSDSSEHLCRRAD